VNNKSVRNSNTTISSWNGTITKQLLFRQYHERKSTSVLCLFAFKCQKSLFIILVSKLFSLTFAYNVCMLGLLKAMLQQ